MKEKPHVFTMRNGLMNLILITYCNFRKHYIVKIWLALRTSVWHIVFTYVWYTFKLIIYTLRRNRGCIKEFKCHSYAWWKHWTYVNNECKSNLPNSSKLTWDLQGAYSSQIQFITWFCYIYLIFLRLPSCIKQKLFNGLSFSCWILIF